MSTTHVTIPPTRNPQKASERYMPMIRLTKCSEDSIHALICGTKKHRRRYQHRRCRRSADTPPERPDRRHGGVRGNCPAPGRGSTPPSGAEVDSLRGVRVDAEALDAIAARMGV